MSRHIFILILFTSFLVIADENARNLEQGIVAYKNKNYMEAEEILNPLSNNGDIIAQYYLGNVYRAYDNAKMNLKKGMWMQCSD